MSQACPQLYTRRRPSVDSLTYLFDCFVTQVREKVRPWVVRQVEPSTLGDWGFAFLAIAHAHALRLGRPWVIWIQRFRPRLVMCCAFRGPQGKAAKLAEASAVGPSPPLGSQLLRGAATVCRTVQLHV